MTATAIDFGNLEAELFRVIFLMVRIGAAFLVAPLFGAVSVPVQVRLVLAGAVGVFVAMWVPVDAPDAILSVTGLLAVVSEAAIGLAFGLVLQLAFAAPVIAAEMIAGAMGVAMATAVDPGSGAQSGALGQYFTLLLTLIFLGLGGHLLWLQLLIDSYTSLPPGLEGLGAEKAAKLAGLAGQMFATAMAIALPVTLILLLVQIATGVLGRSAPALNLFSLGLPAGVLAGLAALIATVPGLTEQFVDLSLDAIAQTRDLFAS